ncbi:hypothetical protein AR691_20025 [Bacillus amyloliquefaciens]|nr:hypothetical protein AR691_20025 [Bacillus amyloliquefaciens]
MIELGSRRTPPYDDTGVKTSISDLKDKMGKASGPPLTIWTCQDEIKNDILNASAKSEGVRGRRGRWVYWLRQTQQIQSMKAGLESFGRVLDAQCSGCG